MKGIIEKMQEARREKAYKTYRMLCQSLWSYIDESGTELYDDELVNLEEFVSDERDVFYNFVKSKLSNFTIDDSESIEYKYLYQIHIELVRLVHKIEKTGYDSITPTSRIDYRKKR